MAKKLGLHFIELSKRFLESRITLQKYRMGDKDFTRKQKLTFPELSLCMLRLLRQNIQVELYKYFSDLKKALINKSLSFTSSAFVQSRKKLKPDMFYDLSSLIANDFYEHNDEVVELYKGHRLLSIDGSTINLPVNEQTKEIYGIFNNQNQSNDVVIARVSIMYDVLNEIVLDGKLCNYSLGEVPLSRQHVQLAKANDIIIMDRAYSSFETMFEMQKGKVHFIYRCKTNFSNVVKQFYESKHKDAIHEIRPTPNDSFKNLPYNKDCIIKVRLLSIELCSGEVEILMTSLLDDKIYCYDDFKSLYFKRWGIETYYNRFKNIICIENFSGKSNQFILQEFNCALYMSNMQSILTKEAQQEANKKYENRKYEYKINASISLCLIRSKLVELFSSKNQSEEIMQELKQLFILNVIPIRPDRKFERNPDKYRNRTKPKQFINRRIIL